MAAELPLSFDSSHAHRARAPDAERGEDVAGPLVSVVIPCFQAQSTIALQLASLSDQVDAPPFEVAPSTDTARDNMPTATASASRCFHALSTLAQIPPKPLIPRKSREEVTR